MPVPRILATAGAAAFLVSGCQTAAPADRAEGRVVEAPKRARVTAVPKGDPELRTAGVAGPYGGSRIGQTTFEVRKGTMWVFVDCAGGKLTLDLAPVTRFEVVCDPAKVTTFLNRLPVRRTGAMTPHVSAGDGTTWSVRVQQ